MLWTRWNWRKLFSYGEVICFVSAWALSLLLAGSAERAPRNDANTQFAATAEVTGMQAQLHR
jgi:hypothetical protein